jgi:hypothetical protein
VISLITRELVIKAKAPVTKLADPKPSEQSIFLAMPGAL